MHMSTQSIGVVRIGEAKWRSARGAVPGRRGTGLARAARLGIAAAAVLIFTALSLQAQSPETVLYSFTGAVSSGPDGAAPAYALLRDGSGNLYGVTESGGADGEGTVFELIPPSSPSGTYTEKVLYSFAANASLIGDGASPVGGVIMDSSCNLYGVTTLGGASGYGTVFELVYSSSCGIPGTYTEKVLYSFAGQRGGDGFQPTGVVRDPLKGNLFGTTTLGGLNNNGTVFELVKNSDGTYTENVLHSFAVGTDPPTDGLFPYGGVIMDSAGNLYGTTSGGGPTPPGASPSTCPNPAGCGMVFEFVNNNDGTYTEKPLYSFNGGATDGQGPTSNLLMDSSNNLYGMTQFGGYTGTPTTFSGKQGPGTVFELAYDSTTKTYATTDTVLHIFTGPPGDGGSPYGGVIMDSSFNLYGTTQYGSGASVPANCGTSGCGTVFELLYSAAGYTETLLYSFDPSLSTTQPGDGEGPNGGLAMDSSGNLYGTATGGGYTTPSGGGVQSACPSGCGIVFELVPNPNISYTNIAIFSAGAVGLGSAQVGSSAVPEQLTLQNEGGTVMTVSSITVTTTSVYSNQFYISSASCLASSFPQVTFPLYIVPSFNIVAGDKCTFTLGLTPEFSAAVMGQIAFVETAASSNICPTKTSPSPATCITESNGLLEETIPLDGTGTGMPGISVSAQSVNFPNQTLGVQATAPPINVSNTGNVPLYFAGIGITGTNAADFGETTTCSTSSPLPVTGNNVCMITVTFTPSTTAQESATLSIFNAAIGQSIPLTGNGVVPTASAQPTTLSFGLQLDTQVVVGVAGTPMSVTLKNTGTAGVLTPINPTITAGANTNAGDFSLNPAGNCGSTLAAGASCKIFVTFAPTVAIPSSSTSGVMESATLSITDNASSVSPSQEPQIVALSGTGVPFTFGTPPSPAMIADGQPDMFTIDVTVGPGSGTLTFACTGLTASGVVVLGATCTFNPPSIMQKVGTTQTVPVMVTITTTAAGALPERRPALPLDGLRRWLPFSLIATILLLGLWVSLAAAQKRRARAAWALLALVVLCGGWMAACSTSSGGSSTPPATQTGQDTFTITGKLGNLTESFNAVLNVTQ
jgi:uncharacterized repeat protein (TIGR03803 family)